MDKYKGKSTFWLMDHLYEVAGDLSNGNSVAADAIASLLMSVKGARAFGDMKVILSSDEWEKLYRICGKDQDLLCSNIIAINLIKAYRNDANGLIHRNLRFKDPALFTEHPIEDPHGMYQKELFELEKKCEKDFMLRYLTAKKNQPE